MLPKIYFVEDEPDLTEAFVDYLGSEQYEILIFNEPREALAAIQTAPPKIIFLDYHMPGITGDSMATLLDPGIVKVLITGNIEVKPKADFARVFHKPIDFAAVQKFIAETLGLEKAA